MSDQKNKENEVEKIDFPEMGMSAEVVRKKSDEEKEPEHVITLENQWKTFRHYCMPELIPDSEIEKTIKRVFYSGFENAGLLIRRISELPDMPPEFCISLFNRLHKEYEESIVFHAKEWQNQNDSK